MSAADPQHREPADDALGDPLGAAEDRGLLSELGQFLGENKKWWLIPILLSIALLGGLVLLSGTGAAPFIYTLF